MFTRVVALYRALGEPDIVDGIISYEGDGSESILAAIDSCENLPESCGKFEYRSVEPEGVSIDYRLPSNEYGRFFLTLGEFISANGSLGKGVFPSNIYIAELKWCDSDAEEPVQIKLLRRICRLVELLSLLAIGVDKDSSPDSYNLFFALPPDGGKPPRTFLLPTKISQKLISYDLTHIGLLEEILNPKNENKAHLTERKLMFRMSVASVVERFEAEQDLFLAVVREWREVLSIYRANLQTYVYSFSFEKVRREVAQAEIDYGSKLSGVLGDIAGKMLALPISFAGLIALDKATSWFEMLVIVLGLVVVTVVLLAILHNQMLQVERLLHSFNVIFDDFKGKIKTYPLKLQVLLNLTIDQVERQGVVLKHTFRVLQFLAVLPLIGVAFWACVKVIEFLASNSPYLPEITSSFALI